MSLENKNILLTGGAGFIGSHTAVCLLEANCNVFVIDNLANSSEKAIERVKSIVGDEHAQRLHFTLGDVKDTALVDQVLSNNKIDAVVHFAGLKAVGESVQIPLRYYDENINSTISLLQAMTNAKVTKLVFSSSATVYGEQGTPPYFEDSAVDIDSISNPYGQTKLMIEQILKHFKNANPDWSICLLRYFNPIGAHPSGLIGEDPIGIPNNLMPFITRVAIGELPELTVFGNDYDTPDGTCERDYLHVCDLAEGHAAALRFQLQESTPSLQTYNLGTGKANTVLEVINAFEQASGQKVSYKIGARRSGDVPATFADVSKAKQELGWQTQCSLEDCCRDAWNWQSRNPQGYR
ncbi:MAG: UDP-glucose 4-epimerase GalE [Bdellovibrionales bacterium]|nr:UDP-glucose 4-epimerase GalE [Bdellovibrionales bacterium]